MPVCPQCGQEVEAGSAYCNHCGYQMEIPQPVQPEAAPGAVFQELQLGAYLKTGWEIFKQYPVGFIAFSLVYLVALTVISYPRGIGWLAAAAIHEPLIAGYIIVAAKLMQGRNPNFSDFFGGFQFRFFLPLVLLGLVSRVLITIGLFLLIIPGLYLAVSYIFAALLVVDRRLDFWAAMEESRRRVTPRWFSFFVLVLLLVLVNIAGILALGVGLLVSIPISWCALVAAYDDLFGLKFEY
jgi:uncharacterized membrane protein